MEIQKKNRFWQMSLSTVLAATLLAGCGGSGSGSDDDEEELASASTERTVSQGKLNGTLENGMLSFKGIPYARPPVGNLRYTAPQPAGSWEGTLEAKEFGGSCIQPQSTFGASESTEDCLYLNVYPPENADGNNAVMVWIHGGAFETGSGDSYVPSGLIKQDAVVVTLNYRLGVLGFLSHPDLASEDPDGYSGSWGLLDQQLALQWVQDNIASFGGNPDNVTIFGESAGGASVMAHVVSPAATALFHKAIVQSGAYTGTQPSQADIEAAGDAFYQGLTPGCNDIACIRSLDAATIQSAQAAAGLSFVPSRRGDVLPQSISTALATGSYNKVPMITGSNLDEWRLFVAIGELTRIQAFIAGGATPADAVMQAMLKPADYANEIASTLGLPSAAAAGGIEAEYPLSDYANNTSIALSAVGTDAIFACNTLGQSAQLVPTSENAVYVYEFVDQDAPKIIPEGNTFDLGAAHAFEIQYVFNDRQSRAAALADGGRGMTGAQLDLADAMTGYWAQFAKTGDPNSSMGTGVNWPTLNSGGGILKLDPSGIVTQTTAEFSASHHCDFWAL